MTNRLEPAQQTHGQEHTGKSCLEMSAISKRFGPTIALDRVNLKVRRGEVHALVGENGAGKSTLMKILSGAYQPDSGHMLLEGQAYAPHNPLDGRRAGVAMIYQELSLAGTPASQGTVGTLRLGLPRDQLFRTAELPPLFFWLWRLTYLAHLFSDWGGSPFGSLIF